MIPTLLPMSTTSMRTCRPAPTACSGAVDQLDWSNNVLVPHLCGNVRIVASGLPYRVGLCHCLDWTLPLRVDGNVTRTGALG